LYNTPLDVQKHFPNSPGWIFVGKGDSVSVLYEWWGVNKATENIEKGKRNIGI